MKSREEYLDKWICGYSKMFEFSGSIAILSKGNVIYKKNIGQANRELNIPISDETVFRIYSMTKPFCAIALMLLKERGKILLDSHPGEYVSNLKWLNPNITLRMILTHSSGIADFKKSEEFKFLKTMYPVDDEMMIDSLKKLPLDFKPGSNVNYINAGFFMISMVIEAVSGMKWNEFIEREVFAPLGMKNTCMDSAQKIILNRADGYDLCKDKIVKALPLCIDSMKGAGAAVSTLEDICIFHNAVRQRKLLSDESWNEIFKSANDCFGLGCMVNYWHNKLRYTHNGGYYGFRSLHIMLPNEDFGIIILSNSGYGNVRGVLPEVIHNIFFEETYVDKQFVLDKGFAHNSEFIQSAAELSRPEKIALNLDKYVGTYTDGIEVAEVEKGKTGGYEIIYIKTSDGRCIGAYPIAEDLFFNIITDESYRFEMKNGVMSLMGLMKR